MVKEGRRETVYYIIQSIYNGEDKDSNLVVELSNGNDDGNSNSDSDFEGDSITPENYDNKRYRNREGMKKLSVERVFKQIMEKIN